MREVNDQDLTLIEEIPPMAMNFMRDLLSKKFQIDSGDYSNFIF